MSVRVLYFLVFAASAVQAQSDFTGSWSGTYTATSTGCSPAVPQGGGMTLNLTQSGTSVSGTIGVEIVLQNCKTAAPTILSAPASGTVSGNTLTATFAGGGTVTADIAGSAIALAFSVGDTSGVGLLSKAGVPPANFAGDWSGTYNAVATLCTPPQATSGSVKLTLAQSGSSLTGTMTLISPIVDCQPSQQTISMPVNGTVDVRSFKVTFSGGPGIPGGQATGSMKASGFDMGFVAGDTSGKASMSADTSPATDVTGTWDGTLTLDERCNNAPVTGTTPITLSLVQSGDGATGTLLLASVPDRNNQCVTQGTFPMVVPLFLRVSGTQLNGSLLGPGLMSMPITLSLSGTTLSVNFSDDEAVGSGTATRTSAQKPDAALSGAYSGTYSNTEAVTGCNNATSISYSGPTSANLMQRGPFLAGPVIASNTKHYVPDTRGNCTVQPDEDFAGLVSAQISGSSISGIIFPAGDNGQEDAFPLTGSISGSVITLDVRDGGDHFAATLTRQTGTSPAINRFVAAPAKIISGQSSTLSWTTSNTTSVTIDNGIGSQAPSGSAVVRPTVTTTYTLIAGTASAKATVTVGPSGTPRVVVARHPDGFVQRSGEGGGTDVFALANIGTAAADVTLAADGDFFTVAPQSFSIPDGGIQRVTITGKAQPAGPYSGTVAISGVSYVVKVRMLSAAPQTGTQRPRAARARIEISSLPGESPTATLQFTNTGTGTVQAIAVSDVPWITPQSGLVEIGPGQTVPVSFSVDSSKRPDGDAPLGAAAGKLSLVYIGSAPGNFAVAADGGTSSVSVTLVYVVRPGVSAGSPPPLNPGELALFAPGLSNRTNATGDLLLANRTSDPLTALQLYVQGSGAQSQTTTLSQLVANSSIALPGLLKNVFSSSVPSGTAQVRGAGTSSVTMASIQSNTSSPVGTYSTALPVFRSDRSTGNNEAIVLGGLQKDSNTQTDLYVQEIAGAAGTFRVDFLDAAGRVLSSRTSDSVAAFGFFESLDAVPSGAATAKITNTSSTARLAAYALVTSSASGDGWLVTDPSAGTSDSSLIVPILSAGNGAQTVLYTTNRTATPVNVTIDVRAGTSRRRAVRNGSSSSNALHPQTDAAPATIGASETLTTPITATNGFVRISGPSGAISAAARSVRTSGTSTFGSGLPAVPASSAMQPGEVRRFAAVEDSSNVSRDASVPATFRTHLMLVETAGQPATARVTLQFAFSGGSLVSSSARVSKDFTLGANQARLISDVAREVIGSNRDQFGDLRNMTLDVEVVNGSGSGQVIPFLQSIDNGSGDMIVRVE